MRFALIRICQRAAPSVTACAVPPSSGRKALVFRTIQTCLSLWERCRAATERAGSLLEGAGLPLCGKTEGVLQIGKIRIRFALMQTHQRAAPSVTACAVPPSSGRKALVFRTVQTCLSLWERCRAATERADSAAQKKNLPRFCERFFLLVELSPRNPARRQSAP